MEKWNELQDHLTANELLEMRDRLDDELQYLLTAQQTLHETSEGGPEENVMRRIVALKQQLMKQSTVRSYSELQLKRIEMRKLMCSKLFSEEDSESAVKNSLEKLELAQQVLRIEEETKELAEELHNQELENFKLKTENLEFLEKLKVSKEKAALPSEVTLNREYRRLKNELQIKCQSITIYQNLFQRLIFGLGLNLEEEKDLEDLLEKCNESHKF